MKEPLDFRLSRGFQLWNLQNFHKMSYTKSVLVLHLFVRGLLSKEFLLMQVVHFLLVTSFFRVASSCLHFSVASHKHCLQVGWLTSWQLWKKSKIFEHYLVEHFLLLHKNIEMLNKKWVEVKEGNLLVSNCQLNNILETYVHFLPFAWNKLLNDVKVILSGFVRTLWRYTQQTSPVAKQCLLERTCFVSFHDGNEGISVAISNISCDFLFCSASVPPVH